VTLAINANKRKLCVEFRIVKVYRNDVIARSLVVLLYRYLVTDIVCQKLG